jgi:hypothetical protein
LPRTIAGFEAVLLICQGTNQASENPKLTAGPYSAAVKLLPMFCHDSNTIGKFLIGRHQKVVLSRCPANLMRPEHRLIHTGHATVGTGDLQFQPRHRNTISLNHFFLQEFSSRAQ